MDYDFKMLLVESYSPSSPFLNKVIHFLREESTDFQFFEWEDLSVPHVSALAYGEMILFKELGIAYIDSYPFGKRRPYTFGNIESPLEAYQKFKNKIKLEDQKIKDRIEEIRLLREELENIYSEIESVINYDKSKIISRITSENHDLNNLHPFEAMQAVVKSYNRVLIKVNEKIQSALNPNPSSG